MAVSLSYGDELTELRDGFGLTDVELAEALVTTPRTLRRWVAATAVPRPDARARIEDLLDLLQSLRRSVVADAIPKWIRRRVDLLEGERPADVLVAGEHDRLFAVAEALDTGSFV